MNGWVNDIHQGDVIETLREMPESSIHMAMCSPPYYGLRDYGAEGQIGLEDTLDEYIQNLVNVGDELQRVLRPDGSWWLNLGDSFAGSGGGGGQWTDESHGTARYDGDAGDSYNGPLNTQSFQRKQKMLVPHRVAIALQEAGWVVRSDAVWAKPNPMPSPVKDRLNEHKEFVFHLTPEPDYWFDLDPIREAHTERSLERMGEGPVNADTDGRGTNDDLHADQLCHPNGKNPGDVLEVTVKPFPEAHFAVYPPELCETPIKASCPPTVCAECGTPYERETEQVPMWERDPSEIDRPQTKRALELADEHGLTEDHFQAAQAVGLGNLDGGEGNPYDRVDDETAALAREAADALGSYYREALMSETAATDEWRQACDCSTGETEPGVVLDPFAGAGTTCLVAKKLGRRFVGIELNPEYVAMAQKRVGVTVDQPELLLDDGQATLADGGFTNVADVGGEGDV